MSPRAATTIHVEDLIGAPVRGADGKALGRVIDLEVRPHEGWRVVRLVLGRFAFVDRLDMLRAMPYRVAGLGRERVVEWDDVESFENRRITLRRGARILEPEPVAEGRLRVREPDEQEKQAEGSE